MRGARITILPEPTVTEIEQLASRVASRIEKLLRKSGRFVEDSVQAEQGADPEQTALSSCYEAAARGLELLGERAGQRSLRVLGGNESRKRVAPQQGLVAEVRGVNIHFETVVDGRDRKRLERLCSYIARPAIAQDRLEQLPDGRLRYAMKQAWSDGTSALIFEPMSLMARLVALISPPRFHLLRFAGVLSAHATLRRHVVPRTSPVDPNPQSPW